MSIPSKRKENLKNCKTCKRSFTLALSNLFLKNVAQFLKGRQRLIVAGGFQRDLVDRTLCVDERGIPQPEPQLSNNAEETDTRIWRHIRQSTETNCLVVSPDTDVYMRGLPLDHEEKNIIIQINPLNKTELKFLNLTLFISAIKNNNQQNRKSHKHTKHYTQLVDVTTVEPLNKGQVGTSTDVCYSEVVLY